MPNKILLGVAVIVIVFSMLVMQQPDSYRVERSIEIDAPAARVYAVIADLKQWPAWSPWAKRDPDMKMEFSETTTGIGAWATWDSESEGQGRQTISEAIDNQSLKIDLEFLAPFAAQASADFRIAAGPDGNTLLTWGMDGNNDGFVTKVFYLLMDVDSMIGTDYESGLLAIKALSEQD